MHYELYLVATGHYIFEVVDDTTKRRLESYTILDCSTEQGNSYKVYPMFQEEKAQLANSLVQAQEIAKADYNTRGI